MDFIRPELIPDPTVRRLSLYLRQLEYLSEAGKTTVNSKQLGDSLGMTDAQVRKDLAYFGTFGHPGVGYNIADLMNRIKQLLGTDKLWHVLLIGVGNLGRALLSYPGFVAKNLQIVAAFDADPNKIGQTIGSIPVHAMDQLKIVAARENCRLAIMTVPNTHAQPVADALVAAGVKGILNFSPISINVPANVAVQAVDVALLLEQLTFQVSLNAMTRTGVRHP